MNHESPDNLKSRPSLDQLVFDNTMFEFKNYYSLVSTIYNREFSKPQSVSFQDFQKEFERYLTRENDISKNLESIDLEIIKNSKYNIICKHFFRETYSKGMCKVCYNYKGRRQYATKCEHSDALNYAHGLCSKCYNNDRNHRKRLEEFQIEDVSDN